MEEFESTLGSCPDALCKYRGLSPQELAEETGISRRNLNCNEHDASKPMTEYLKLLYQFYRVSPEYLLAGMQEFAARRKGWRVL